MFSQIFINKKIISNISIKNNYFDIWDFRAISEQIWNLADVPLCEIEYRDE